jgi:hypothetical protein
LETEFTGPVLVELLAAARIALCVQAALPVDAVVLVDPVFVGVVAVVVVVVGATVDVVVEPADWLLGLLEQPASTAAPIRTAITPPAVALVMPSSVPELVAAVSRGLRMTVPRPGSF